MDNYIRFDWAMNRLLRNKSNYEVLEGFREDQTGHCSHDEGKRYGDICNFTIDRTGRKRYQNYLKVTFLTDWKVLNIYLWR